VSPADVEAIRRTGVAVIKGVVPTGVAEGLLSDVRQYFDEHSFKGFPSGAEKKVKFSSSSLEGRILTCFRLSTSHTGVLPK